MGTPLDGDEVATADEEIPVQPASSSRPERHALIREEVNHFDEFVQEYDPDTQWDDFVEVYSDVGLSEGVWSGAPMPDDHYPLWLNDNTPYPDLDGRTIAQLNEEDEAEEAIRTDAYFRWEAAGRPEGRDLEFWEAARLAAEAIIERVEDEDSEWEEINHWFSVTKTSWVYLSRHKATGKLRHVVQPYNPGNRLGLELATARLVRTWSLRAELRAVEKLKQHINENQYKSYMLVGAFVERSRRSNLQYMLRRCRPTLVFSPKGRLLIALCSHITGFYDWTWAGVHVPSDDVLGNLLRIRHDEHRFWKRAKHHRPESILSGV